MRGVSILETRMCPRRQWLAGVARESHGTPKSDRSAQPAARTAPSHKSIRLSLSLPVFGEDPKKWRDGRDSNPLRMRFSLDGVDQGTCLVALRWHFFHRFPSVYHMRL